MSRARLRSTAGSGLARLTSLPTVRKKTGVDVGVGNPTLDSELGAVLLFKKAPLATCRRFHSFDFALSKRSAQRRGSLPKAGLNMAGFLEKHESPCHVVTRQFDVEQKGQAYSIRVAQRLEPSRRASPKEFLTNESGRFLACAVTASVCSAGDVNESKATTGAY